MPTDPQSLLDKIRSLPAEQAAEVEDFVEFLSAKARRQAALERLVAVVPALEQAGASPIAEDDIAAEVKAARQVRRAQPGGAARS